MAPTLTDSPPDSTAQQPAIAEIARSSRHSRTTLILLLLLLVHVGWIVWNSATNMPAIDFLTFWSVPHTLGRAHARTIYSLEGERQMAALIQSELQSPSASNLQRTATLRVLQLYDGRIDVTGTPFLYSVIGWLSSGSFTTDQKRFVFLCTVCLAVSLLLLGNVLRFSFVQVGLVFIFTATYYAPLLADMQVGNINSIELLGVVLFIVLMIRSQPLLAGLVLGTAMMFKPMPGMILPLSIIAFLIDREYRQLLLMLAGSVLAAAACFLASAAYFRTPAIWFDFLHSLPRTLSGTSYSLGAGNFSLSAQIVGSTGVLSAVVPLVLLTAFGWLFFRTRQSSKNCELNGDLQFGLSRRTHTAFAVGGGGCAIVLLTSPLVWPHYFVLLLPLTLYVMRPAADSGSVLNLKCQGVWTIAESVLPFVLFGMFSFLAELMVGNTARSICILFSVATLSTLAFACYRIWQSRAAATPPKRSPAFA